MPGERSHRRDLSRRSGLYYNGLNEAQATQAYDAAAPAKLSALSLTWLAAQELIWLTASAR